MKNTMKMNAKNEVFESLAHCLTLRHAYKNEKENYRPIMFRSTDLKNYAILCPIRHNEA